LDEEKSKHASLAQENGFGSQFAVPAKSCNNNLEYIDLQKRVQ
jgi:hypothetical protein